MLLAEYISRETGVPPENIMLLRHSSANIERLTALGSSIHEYTAMQPIGSKYDYRDPAKTPIKALAVVVADRLFGIYRVAGVESEGTTYTLVSAAHRQFDIDRGHGELPARLYKLEQVDCDASNCQVHGWERRSRTTVQRSDGGFFNEIVIDLPAFATPHKRDAREARMRTLGEQLDHEAYFDPKNPDDARRKIEQTVVVRQGQPKFRRELLDAYSGRCAISGCSVTEVLEAAHIVQYRGNETNTIRNGLLLRADLHTLMDCLLLVIHPEQYMVLVAEEARRDEYLELHGKLIRLPDDERAIPAAEYLRFQYEAVEWAERAYAQL